MKKYPIWAIGTTLFIIAFIITLVIFGVRTARVPFDLVAPDYYDQEIAYQDRIDATARADKLQNKPVVGADATDIVLTIPQSISEKLDQGKLILYRPSDASQDVQVPVEPGAKRVTIPLAGKPSGNWKVKFHWKMDGQAYYREYALYL